MSSKEMTSKYGPTRVIKVDVTKLKFTYFNPPGRTTERSLRSLMGLIVDAGGILDPVTVTSDLVLVDGNRRTHCAHALGIPTLEAIQYVEVSSKDDIRFKQLFNTLNEANRKLSPQEQLTSALMGGVCSAKISARAAEARAILGDGVAMDEFVKAGTPPQAIANANRAFAICKYAGLVSKSEEQKFKAEVILYQISVRQQQDLKNFMNLHHKEVGAGKRTKRFRYSPQKMIQAIHSRKPIFEVAPPIA